MTRNYHRIVHLSHPTPAEHVAQTLRKRHESLPMSNRTRKPFCAYISSEGFEKSKRSSNKQVDVFSGVRLDQIKKKIKKPAVLSELRVHKTACGLYTRSLSPPHHRRRVNGFGARSGGTEKGRREHRRFTNYRKCPIRTYDTRRRATSERGGDGRSELVFGCVFAARLGGNSSSKLGIFLKKIFFLQNFVSYRGDGFSGKRRKK